MNCVKKGQFCKGIISYFPIYNSFVKFQGEKKVCELCYITICVIMRCVIKKSIVPKTYLQFCLF